MTTSSSVSNTLSVLSTFPAVIAILSFIWAAGITYQRIVYIETWRDQVKDQMVTEAAFKEMQTNYAAQLKALEVKFENEIKLERAFSRSLCVALSHTQQAAKIPVTNDCARP